MTAGTGVAASAVLPVLTGEPLTGTVFGVVREAVIIAVNPPTGPRIVTLMTPTATGVPNGVRTVAEPNDAGCVPGDPVRLGHGQIELGELEVRVVRSWNSAVPRIRPDPAAVAAVVAAAARAELGVARDAVQNLRSALTDGGDDLGAAVVALVGRGSGLTPGGDDVLAGLLTALHARGMTVLAGRIGADAVRRAADSTTLLSADLLRLAAGGHGCQELLAVLRALPGTSVATPAGRVRLASAIEALLSVGHTSGADLAAGLSIGLRHHQSPATQPLARQEV